MPTPQLNSQINRLCEDLIAKQWGNPADFPDEIRQAVFRVYRTFITGYLNFLRQKEAKPSEWVPEKLVIDWGLVDDMRHFFSDYQHITRSFLNLNRHLNRLRDIDTDKQPELYRELASEILACTA
ncbi:MAG: hypothetical protein PVI38_06330 [Desulfobacterales bacterium]